MASFLLSEAFLVEKIISSGHADLDDLPMETSVCIDLHQAYCEAIKNMVECSLERNCEDAEEEAFRVELVKTMRRKGISTEKRYVRLKEVIISASRTFSAEKTYFNVRRAPILAACVVDEQRIISDSLQLLGDSDNSKDASSSAKKPSTRKKPLQGCGGRVLPPLPANEEALARIKRARFDNDFRLIH